MCGERRAAALDGLLAAFGPSGGEGRRGTPPKPSIAFKKVAGVRARRVTARAPQRAGKQRTGRGLSA